MKTYWYYKNAHLIDQSWSVRACGVRQRHVDQAQSMNLYITNDFTMRQVLELYLLAWRMRGKDYLLCALEVSGGGRVRKLLVLSTRRERTHHGRTCEKTVVQPRRRY